MAMLGCGLVNYRLPIDGLTRLVHRPALQIERQPTLGRQKGGKRDRLRVARVTLERSKVSVPCSVMNTTNTAPRQNEKRRGNRYNPQKPVWLHHDTEGCGK